MDVASVTIRLGSVSVTPALLVKHVQTRFWGRRTVGNPKRCVQRCVADMDFVTQRLVTVHAPKDTMEKTALGTLVQMIALGMEHAMQLLGNANAMQPISAWIAQRGSVQSYAQSQKVLAMQRVAHVFAERDSQVLTAVRHCAPRTAMVWGLVTFTQEHVSVRHHLVAKIAENVCVPILALAQVKESARKMELVNAKNHSTGRIAVNGSVHKLKMPSAQGKNRESVTPSLEGVSARPCGSVRPAKRSHASTAAVGMENVWRS